MPTSAQAQGPHTYAISFTPRDPIVHTVDLRFNGEDVPGSPFSCQVIYCYIYEFAVKVADFRTQGESVTIRK